MVESGRTFIEWKEQFVSQERGSRLVHYFLKDSDGGSVLAVVGTERSLRHMLYVVSEDFTRAYGTEKMMPGFKWRSRREVVDWLTSMLSKQQIPRDCSKSCPEDPSHALDSTISSFKLNNAGEISNSQGQFGRRLKGNNSDILWFGAAWTCGKQLKHYEAFHRNGTTISIHSFVLVMAKEDNHYLAYLEDMYEDKRRQKKVKVRWFHQNQEVSGSIPPPPPHPKEVFMTPYSQVISAECVDGLATVLTSEHYSRYSSVFSDLSPGRVHLCFRQFNNNKVENFDLTKLQGYFNQAILSSLDPYDKNELTTLNFNINKGEDFNYGIALKQGPKGIRSCRTRQRFQNEGFCGGETVFTSTLMFRFQGQTPLALKDIGSQQWVLTPFKVGQKIEVLCQDSGIRGCWFRCTVLGTSRKHLKVQYDDLKEADEGGNLEEWIPSARHATPDKLGMRYSYRLTVRPYPPSKKGSTKYAFEIGTAVDAWWSDGWWEGVVIEVDKCRDDSLKVHIPGEDLNLNCRRDELRISMDWVGNQWIDIESKPDILSIASAFGFKSTDSGSSGMSDRQILISRPNSVEGNEQTLPSHDETESTQFVISKKRKRDNDDDDDEMLGGDDGLQAGIEDVNVNDDKLLQNETVACEPKTCEETAAQDL